MNIIQNFVHGFKLNCNNICVESSLTDLLQLYVTMYKAFEH